MKLREWKNGKYLPKWTCRIRWFAPSHDEGPVRLELLDCSGTYVLPNNSITRAEFIWSLFKKLAPAEGVNEPVTQKVLEELEEVQA